LKWMRPPSANLNNIRSNRDNENNQNRRSNKQGLTHHRKPPLVDGD
jgi:hypothetical protein